MVVRFITRRFIGEYDPSLEKVYAFHTVMDDEMVYFDILDTAGQPHVSHSIFYCQYLKEFPNFTRGSRLRAPFNIIARDPERFRDILHPPSCFDSLLFYTRSWWATSILIVFKFFIRSQLNFFVE